jgi:hypothetical protein
MEKKRLEVAALLTEMHFNRMDTPSNFDEIVDYCLEDINETADAVNWTSEDVTIAFRRWIESKSIANVQPKENLYFEIVAQGYDEELQREQIQIHAGKNGNVFLIKNDDGFIVDVYNQNENIDSMPIWEDDLTPEEEDDADVVFDFSYPKVMAFIKKWGRSEEEVFIELELDADSENANDAMCEAYFWEDTNKVWIPKLYPLYNEEEQAIADYLQQPVT